MNRSNPIFKVVVAVGLALLAALVSMASIGCNRNAREPLSPPDVDGGGIRGGRLVAALRSDPGTFNPVVAYDASAQAVHYLTTARLTRINRYTQQVEPELAESWTISEDGTTYTLGLRRGLRFSDGEPFDADDVVFSFRAYQDPELGSPQGILLSIDGEPIQVSKLDSHTVVFELAKPYAVAMRLFDGVAILPEHLLGAAYREGSLAEAWGVNTPPELMATLGAFAQGEFRPGESLQLVRNPNYWKTDSAGQALPYLDEIVLRIVASEDTEAIRFQNGELDISSQLTADNYAALEAQQDERGYVLDDLGASLRYHFLFFNLNDLSQAELPRVARRQRWFKDREFRHAVSQVIDREAMVRLVFRGRATPLAGPVTEGNRLWRNDSIDLPERSVEQARSRLARAGYAWDASGLLIDAEGSQVEFTVVTNANNAQRVKMLTILQEDLRELGIEIQAVPLDFQSLVSRVLERHDYDACLLGLRDGDVDPNTALGVWLSSGGQHLWAPSQLEPATPWEAEIDSLMRAQISETNSGERKRLFDRVQEIVAIEQPLISLVSPNVLVGADRRLGNVEPAVLRPSMLWNADRLYWVPNAKNVD